MEEKERYITLSDRQIKDTYNNSQYFMSIKNVCKILNQQDKRIKELEQQLNKDFTLGEYIRLEEENQQLKQSQKQLAISELGKVENWCEEHKYSDDFDYIITYEYDEEDGSGNTDYLKDYIDNQIKELGGE